MRTRLNIAIVSLNKLNLSLNPNNESHSKMSVSTALYRSEYVRPMNCLLRLNICIYETDKT